MNDSLAQWLALREPFDIAARSVALTEAVARALPQNRAVRIVDLGTGTGSNLRYLARHFPADQRWTLVDNVIRKTTERIRRIHRAPFSRRQKAKSY